MTEKSKAVTLGGEMNLAGVEIMSALVCERGNSRVEQKLTRRNKEEIMKQMPGGAIS